MITSYNSSRKLALGMVILAISGLLLGAVLGYFGSHFILEKLTLQQMKKEGYVYTGDATATADDIIMGKAAYSNGELLNGNVIEFNTSDATAKAEYILKGKTAYVDGQLVVGTLQVIPASEVMPKSSPSTITGNVYLSGDIVIKGEANLVSKNIKKGVEIFNVVGSYTPDLEEGN